MERYLTWDEKRAEVARWLAFRADPANRAPDGQEGGYGYPDPAIFPLTDALNALPGVLTVQSCAGHVLRDERDGEPYHVSGTLWLRLGRAVMDRFTEQAPTLTRQPTIERVERMFYPDWGDVAAVTFAGANRGTLGEACAVLTSFFTSIADPGPERRPIQRRPNEQPILERLLQLKRTLQDRDAHPDGRFVSEERREVETIVRAACQRIDAALTEIYSGVRLLDMGGRYRFALWSAFIPRFVLGREAANELRRLLSPNGDQFVDDEPPVDPQSDAYLVRAYNAGPKALEKCAACGHAWWHHVQDGELVCLYLLAVDANAVREADAPRSGVGSTRCGCKEFREP